MTESGATSSLTTPADTVSILLVDDSPANLVALRAILADLDYTLVDAGSGEEALALTRARTFAAILLDLRMPGLGGFETAGRIRAEGRSRTTPILFLTADDADRAETDAGYALGAVDFLVKPLSPVAVRAKVQAIASLFQEAARARRESEELRLLVQQTTDYAIFMLDPSGRVATWNAGAERAKGYRADEIVGTHFSVFYPAVKVAEGWPEHELKVAAADGRFEDEGWRVRKDGSTYWANVVITALRDDGGALPGFSRVTRDLTHRKEGRGGRPAARGRAGGPAGGRSGRGGAPRERAAAPGGAGVALGDAREHRPRGDRDRRRGPRDVPESGGGGAHRVASSGGGRAWTWRPSSTAPSRRAGRSSSSSATPPR